MQVAALNVYEGNEMFILVKDRLHLDDRSIDLGWVKYRQYLHENKRMFPSSAYGFATAEWHYDLNDHRCPHDSWVQSFKIYEDSSGSRSEVRKAQISVELLGAYHDGVIKIDYVNVSSYNLSTHSNCHGDWLYDEVRISAVGGVVHEIDFESSHWVIECADIKYQWLAKII